VRGIGGMAMGAMNRFKRWKISSGGFPSFSARAARRRQSKTFGGSESLTDLRESIEHKYNGGPAGFRAPGAYRPSTPERSETTLAEPTRKHSEGKPSSGHHRSAPRGYRGSRFEADRRLTRKLRWKAGSGGMRRSLARTAVERADGCGGRTSTFMCEGVGVRTLVRLRRQFCQGL
jgi:hypothetical protein